MYQKIGFGDYMWEGERYDEDAGSMPYLEFPTEPVSIIKAHRKQNHRENIADGWLARHNENTIRNK